MHVADFDAIRLHTRLRRRTRREVFLRREFATLLTRTRLALRAVRTVAALGATFATRTIRTAIGALRAFGVLALLRERLRLAIRREQQGRIALQQFRQRRGDFDRRHVLFAFVAFDQLAVQADVAAVARVQRQGVGDAAEEPGDAGVVDALHGRQLHFLDRLAGGSFDRAQHVLLARAHEQDRIAAAPGAAGTTDAVDVALGVVGNVVIQHVADAFHVEAAGGDVGGDEDVDLAVLEILDGLLALRLLHVAVDRGGGQTARLQFLGELIGGQLGAREHQHRVVGLGFEDAGQRIEFVHAADEPETLADVGRGGGFRSNGDFRRVTQIGLGDAADLAGHGRREQRDLTRFRHFLQHGLDIVDEAHAQHFVGFVQHQRLEFRQVQGAAVEMIDDPARGADHDMHAALQRLQLRVVALAAVDRQHVEAGNLVGVTLEGFGDLDREFAGGREHQHLRLALLQIQPRQQRQREGSGLAGAGLGLPEHVATGQQRRNGRGLDRRRGFVSDFEDRRHDCLGQAEIGKTQGRGFGRHTQHPGTSARPHIVRRSVGALAPDCGTDSQALLHRNKNMRGIMGLHSSIRIGIVVPSGRQGQGGRPALQRRRAKWRRHSHSVR